MFESSPSACWLDSLFVVYRICWLLRRGDDRLTERLAYIEQTLGDSVAKHAQDAGGHKKIQEVRGLEKKGDSLSRRPKKDVTE